MINKPDAAPLIYVDTNTLSYSNPFERQTSGQSATFKFKNTLIPDSD